MELIEKLFWVKGVSSNEAPMTVTLNELGYLIEKGLVEIKAEKIRGSLQIELGNYYNDGMGGASGHFGESAERLKTAGESAKIEND